MCKLLIYWNERFGRYFIPPLGGGQDALCFTVFGASMVGGEHYCSAEQRTRPSRHLAERSGLSFLNGGCLVVYTVYIRSNNTRLHNIVAVFIIKAPWLWSWEISIWFTPICLVAHRHLPWQHTPPSVSGHVQSECGERGRLPVSHEERVQPQAARAQEVRPQGEPCVTQAGVAALGGLIMSL